ncbi:polyisoprenoid-binding protein [Xanthomonas campestris pv. campestris]|uniref:YceI family protein n=1 Tax=Xanthomonas campestris TaxID=339 RepID=UPI002269AC42|nr:YceI family protein [Xanthomonas campestris]MDO0791519.1 YceI family protein [Xanthomonas campestris pv. campestris]MDO0839802.1 YceI family protein [Xanthomonas campestris pv. campestris]MEB1349660.1 YceI family protein [Xanthomonas campestris pv. campestris]WDK49112.1 polyisoprenoid-binding protein [Xanthomonas campestris pv. campestris]WDK54636.1 polyisoprenoid-binding protein [Xanthomonas campestris pv. campestris]
MKTTHKLLLPLALTLAIAACSKPADNAAAPAAETPAATAPADAAAAAPAPAADESTAPAVQVASGTYTLDPTHTDVLAQWSHFGFSNPTAHFGNVDGTLVYDAADVTKSTVQVTLPLSGLNSFTAKFDEHLKSGDFFDAAKFPSATFKSTKVESAGTNKLTVTGDLTIKDQTKPVVLDVTLNGAGEHPMKKVPAAGFDATTTIKRSDFGVGQYAPNVSDEVKIRITTEALQAKAGDAAAK